MKRLFISVFLALGIMGVLSAVAPSYEVHAINVFDGCSGNGGTEVCSSRSRDGVNDLVRTVIDLLFYAITIIAVIMIIVGGIKYVTSNGDSSKITSAKNTILYSVVGLVVALLAYAIVGFVVNRFG